MRRPYRLPTAAITTVLCAFGATALLASPVASASAATTSTTDASATSGVVVNEIVYGSASGIPNDSVELYNTSSTAVDLTGWQLADEKLKPETLPGSIVIEPGSYVVLTKGIEFSFGLGKEDAVTLSDASAAVVDSHTYINTAPLHTWARCPDGTGDWVAATAVTLGAANSCEPETTDAVAGSIVINEVDSQPADWVEFYNPGTATLDISGYQIRDNSDDHRWQFGDGSIIAAGEFLVVNEASIGLVGGVEQRFSAAIGIGSTDRIRLYDRTGALIDDTQPWQGHAVIDGDFAAASYARCPDGEGDFVLARETSGASNSCVQPDAGGQSEEDAQPGTEHTVSPWPGLAEVAVVDTTPRFLEDSSGLDTQVTAEGTFLWAVDNGTGTFWKMNVAANGDTALAAGWEHGKRGRFIRDADSPSAAGPDTEGITAAGDGFIYLAAERDNAAKGVNANTVLKVDPNAPGPDVVASQEWDLTTALPAVGANLGLEAVEWVADTELTGKLVTDAGTGYDPADYPGHGDGLFFVAVEDTGGVYAFALNADGSARLVSTLDPGLAGVMALDYDTVLGVIWAVCDDGCNGTVAHITLNGTAQPDVAYFARPAGMPDINNEGFATAPEGITVTGERAAWWLADGFISEALRLGTVPAAARVVASTPTVPITAQAGALGTTTSTLAATGGAPVSSVVVVAVVMCLAGLATLTVRRRSRNS